MPDDIEQEVTEQVETEDDEGFGEGFGDETAHVEEESEEKETKPSESKEEKPVDDKAEAKEKTEAEAKPKTVEERMALAQAAKAEKRAKEKAEAEAKAKGETEKEETPEEDEAEARGKQILEEEAKAKVEADKAKEEAEKKKAAEEAAKGPKFSPPVQLTDQLAKTYVDLAIGPHLPSTVKLGDTEIEIGDFARANPEFAVLAGMQATNIIQRLVDAGVLVTAKSHQDAISKASEAVDAKLFDFAVRQHIPNPGEIYDSKEFKEYYEKAPDTFKALFRSNDPMDHVKGFNKYLGKATAAIKEKVKEIDKEAGKKKETHDAIHAHTMRSATAKTISEALGDADEEFSAGFSGEK